MSAIPMSEIQGTKRQFLVVVVGEYLITGYFWVFSALGSLLVEGRTPEGGFSGQTFFFTMFILMLSNGIWEILTGWYADKFKRQLSISAGFLACCLGFFLMGIAVFFPDGPILNFRTVWYAGVSIWAIGPALLSGAQEAWLVDRCNFFSADPPEDVDDIFKKSAAYGVLAKSMGSLMCFLVLAPSFSGKSDNWPMFVFSAIIAGVVSAWLFYSSRNLREEYWSHPKYQTSESLFSFLFEGLRDLWQTPLRWFALSYCGVMSLNYVLSSTGWTYVTIRGPKDSLLESFGDNRLFIWAIILIFAELLGSVLSRSFSNWIDLIRKRWWRIPIASLVYLISILALLRSSSERFLYVLIFVTFLFRAVYASVFGSLNTIGQLAIKSDERRAVLVSLSSATSSFLMAFVFLVFSNYSSVSTGATASRHIEEFWYVSIPLIVMLAGGGYLATRSRPEVRQSESE
jgi:MFS family permease